MSTYVFNPYINGILKIDGAIYEVWPAQHASTSAWDRIADARRRADRDGDILLWVGFAPPGEHDDTDFRLGFATSSSVSSITGNFREPHSGRRFDTVGRAREILSQVAHEMLGSWDEAMDECEGIESEANEYFTEDWSGLLAIGLQWASTPERAAEYASRYGMYRDLDERMYQWNDRMRRQEATGTVDSVGMASRLLDEVNATPTFSFDPVESPRTNTSCVLCLHPIDSLRPRAEYPSDEVRHAVRRLITASDHRVCQPCLDSRTGTCFVCDDDEPRLIQRSYRRWEGDEEVDPVSFCYQHNFQDVVPPLSYCRYVPTQGRSDSRVPDTNVGGHLVSPDVFHEEHNACETCADENLLGFMQPWNYRPELNFHPALPEGKRQLYIGMELETAFDSVWNGPANRDGVRAWRGKVDSDLIYVKSDSSVVNGIEIVTHPMDPRWALENFPFEAFDELLDDTNAFASHHSAGTHIHMSRSAFSRSHMWTFIQFHYRLAAFCGAIGGRGTEASYGRLTVGGDATQRPKLKDNILPGEEQVSQNGRSSGINMYPENTIELRYPASGVDSASIKKNIEWVLAVYEYTKQITIKEVQAGLFDTPQLFGIWLAERQDEYPTLWPLVQPHIRGYAALADIITGGN